MAFDVCIEVPFLGQYCGSSLDDYIPDLAAILPYVVFNETVNISEYSPCSARGLNMSVPRFKPVGYSLVKNTPKRSRVASS